MDSEVIRFKLFGAFSLYQEPMNSKSMGDPAALLANRTLSSADFISRASSKYSLKNNQSESASVSEKLPDKVSKLLQLPRVQSLLGWMLLHQGQQPRQRCAAALWPDSKEQQRLTNLRRELHRLSPLIECIHPAIKIERKYIGIHLSGSDLVDYHQFNDLLEVCLNQTRTNSDPAIRIGLAAKALQLSDEPLLESLTDEWLEIIRTQVSLDRQQIAYSLSQWLVQEARWSEVSVIARLRLEMDRTDETAMFDLVNALNRDNRQAESARQLRHFQEVLKIELGEGAERRLDVLKHKLNSAQNSRTIGTEPPDYQRKQNKLIVCSNSRGICNDVLIGRDALIDDILSDINTDSQRVGTIKPKIILLHGEAGIGKTKLAEALSKKICTSNKCALFARCIQDSGKIPFDVLAGWLRNGNFENDVNNLSEIQRHSINAIFASVVSNNDHVRESGEYVEIKPKKPLLDRTLLFQVVAKLFTQYSSQPVLLLDDLQWIDEDSLDWLNWFTAQEQSHSVIVIATLRSEELSDNERLKLLIERGRFNDTINSVAINSLAPRDAEILAKHHFDQMGFPDGSISPELTTRVSEKANGNPLFLEEFTRQFAESMKNADNDSEISTNISALPSKVLSVFNLRFATLSENARAVANNAAILGRTVNRKVLLRVSALNDYVFVSVLEELSCSNILTENSGDLMFTHDLIRDALLETLTEPRKIFTHQRCAVAYKNIFQRDIGKYSSLIAVHLESAGMVKEAAEYFLNAAVNAEKSLALSEGIRYCRRGRNLIEVHDNYIESDAAILMSLLLKEAALLSIFEGYNSNNIQNINQKMRILMPKVDSIDLQFWAVNRMRLAMTFSASTESTLKLATESFKLAQISGDPYLICESYRSIGFSNFCLGNFHLAYKNYKKAVDVGDQAYKEGRFEKYNLPFSYLWSRTGCAKMLAVLGSKEKALTLKMDNEHYSHAHLKFENQLHIDLADCIFWLELQDPENMRETLIRLNRLGELSVNPKLNAIDEMFNGWVDAGTGDAQSGIERMIVACNDYHMLEEVHFIPLWHTLLAQRLYEDGRHDQALTYCQTGLDFAGRAEMQSFSRHLLLWKACALNGLAMLDSIEKQQRKHNLDSLKAFEDAISLSKKQNTVLSTTRAHHYLLKLHGISHLSKEELDEYYLNQDLLSNNVPCINAEKLLTQEKRHH